MRFAESGYYIEQYVKCDNCGVLIYGDGVRGQPERQADRLLASPHFGEHFARHWT